MSFVECFLLDFNVATYVETLDSLIASPITMNKLLQFLLFFLPFVVESALVRNNIHILRKKLLGHNIYDRHVKPDGKVDVSFGIDFMDMDLCPHKHVNNIFLIFRNIYKN